MQIVTGTIISFVLKANGAAGTLMYTGLVGERLPLHSRCSSIICAWGKENQSKCYSQCRRALPRNKNAIPAKKVSLDVELRKASLDLSYDTFSACPFWLRLSSEVLGLTSPRLYPYQYPPPKDSPNTGPSHE